LLEVLKVLEVLEVLKVLEVKVLKVLKVLWEVSHLNSRTVLDDRCGYYLMVLLLEAPPYERRLDNLQER